MSPTITAYSNSNLYNESVCETDSKTIHCSIGIINILNAFYGRADNTTCCRSPEFCINTACFSNKTEYFKNICDSLTTCTIQTRFEEDICFLTSKYVRVYWECTSKYFYYLRDFPY